MEDTLREYIDLVSVNPVCLNPCCNGRYSQRNYIISENTLLSVLILVVMEDTLRELSESTFRKVLIVLILVVMEDTLRDVKNFDKAAIARLNPCCNGRYSQSCKDADVKNFDKGLNPCCNGRYSQRPRMLFLSSNKRVLILVVMEDTLRDRLFYSKP